MILTSIGLPKSPKDSGVSTIIRFQRGPMLNRPVDPDQAQENIAYGRALNSEVHPFNFIPELEMPRC